MKVLSAILAGLIAFAIMYLTGSLIQNSFNITYWSETTRGIVGIFGLFFSVIVFVISINMED